MAIIGKKVCKYKGSVKVAMEGIYFQQGSGFIILKYLTTIQSAWYINREVVV
jgi:hypothetical protein